MMHILKAADYPRMPWKNGAGTTLEIARDAGIDLSGFGWRVSIADVGESGTFSPFPGFQRIITVLEGDGMYLNVDGTTSPLLQPFVPYAFSGDSDVVCHLVGGAIRDFNLIYDPLRYSVRLQWIQSGDSQTLFSSAQACLVFNAGSRIDVNVDDDSSVTLAGGDCLQIGNDGQGLCSISLSGEPGQHLCLIELTLL